MKKLFEKYMKSEYLHPNISSYVCLSPISSFALEMSDDDFDDEEGWDARKRSKDEDLSGDEIPTEDASAYGTLW